MNAYPEPGTWLPPLNGRQKPEYRGLVARFVGFVVWLLGWTDWAKAFNTRYHTTLRGTVYSPPGMDPTPSLWLHEGIHAWQERELGVVRYYFRYLLRSQKGRLELEAQAYASEVVAEYRTEARALKGLTGRTYYPEFWFTPTEAQGRDALHRHITGWRDAGHTRDTLRALPRNHRRELSDEYFSG